MRRHILFIIASLLCCACTTVPTQTPPTEPVIANPVETPGPVVIAEPIAEPPPAPIVQAPPPPPAEPPQEPVIEVPKSGFERLPFWTSHDPRPALEAFVRGCESWTNAEPDTELNPNLPQYGRFGDWQMACQGASVLHSVSPTADDSRAFFESWFAPVSLATPTMPDGLLTGYYEPEVDVRLTPNSEFSEPILAKPKDESKLALPRARINARTSRVIAYGRPIDVFFLQIQGSGRLKYGNGRLLRAAYAANNGHSYTSIGRVLVERGAMTIDQASKRSIENWMEQNGPEAARNLMNENARYIYFTEQSIQSGEGPQGAMRTHLTSLGSIAVDPRYHPYGSLVWLDTTLPTKAGDFRGQSTGLLVTAQDTGSAIKGPLRADLFFGSGEAAGAKAGVQKHRARWTILLPRHLVIGHNIS